MDARSNTQIEPQYGDLRDLIGRIDAMGELVKIDGADWDLELGGLLDMIYHAEPTNPPALLFDNIKGYPKGFRVSAGSTGSARRFALIMGLPDPKHPLDAVASFCDRLRSDFKPLPARVVKDGPILENIQRDDDVDILKFPVPKLHELDGGRYIGTNDMVIMRDPDDGWINAATYRVQVHDRNTTGLWLSPGKHAGMILDKYKARGEPCPVLVCCGIDPMLFIFGGTKVHQGISEIDYAGGHKGKPFDVVLSELHKLPIPAEAEVVLEGEIYVDQPHSEGPFGEFTGYYASAVSDEPTIKVRRVYHRNDPILTVACPMRPPTDYSAAASMIHSAMIWDQMERANLPGIRGVWVPWATRLMCFVSIKQMYAGHAKQAAMLAASVQAGGFCGRYTVVVDDDVDPTDMDAVLWAMATRSDPAIDIDVVRQTWSTALDPMLAKPPWHNNRALIDACRPFGRLGDFPPVAEGSPELRSQIRQKWGHLLKRK
jgi:4-hydroxy-3-polyprenylbenzoate decarboxylase